MTLKEIDKLIIGAYKYAEKKAKKEQKQIKKEKRNKHK
jgi:hypothetical protein